MGLDNRTKKLAGIINEAQLLAEASEPKYTENEDLRVGKTYVAIREPYEEHMFYEVPQGTTLKDFKGTGKYWPWFEKEHSWLVSSKGADKAASYIEFIFKVVSI